MGGAERVMAAICRLQVDRGHEVWACLPKGSLIEPQVCGSGVLLFKPALKTPLCLIKLGLRARAMGIDILHAHLTGGTHAANVIGMLSGARVVIHGHTCSTDYNYMWAARRSTMVAVSESVARHYVRTCGAQRDRIVVVANGSDIAHMPGSEMGRDEARASVCAELALPEDSRFLVVAGRLVPLKGQDVLLEAFARLAGDYPELHVVLAGPLEDLAYVKRIRLPAGGKAGERIHVLGLRTDVARLLRAADVAVVPSRHEALPLSVIEPLLLGVPVVASDVGGISEILPGESAPCLVPPEDPGALALAIERILRAPEEAARKANVARLAALDRYSVESMVDGIEAVYRSVAIERAVGTTRA